ncbi:MAG: hypothetical protein HYY45_19520 [Deltaproteobacteria bacterium]|nr:hypothetical protein [Deltaproteobacteria bacterium]
MKTLGFVGTGGMGSAMAYQLFSIAQVNGLDGYEATGIAYHVYSLISGQKRG